VVMPQIKDSKTLAAAGADKEDGRRPTIVSAPAAARVLLSLIWGILHVLTAGHFRGLLGLTDGRGDDLVYLSPGRTGFPAGLEPPQGRSRVITHRHFRRAYRDEAPDFRAPLPGSPISESMCAWIALICSA